MIIWVNLKYIRGHNFGKFLKEMLELALNEDDFVNKVIMGVTDETSSISDFDK